MGTTKMWNNGNNYVGNDKMTVKMEMWDDGDGNISTE